MSKSFDLLYFKALKEAAKSTRQYEPALNRETRVPTELRSRVKQRAKWETMEMPKRTGQYVYIKFSGIKRRGAEYITQLSKADVKKWEKLYFEPHQLEIQKVGKIVFDHYAGAWHHFPADSLHHSSGVKFPSAATDIIHNLAIDLDPIRHSPPSIKRAIETAFGDKPNDMRHYKALVAESNRTGLPTHYKDDLIKHDKRFLSYHDPALPFGWILRESGTHIVDPLSLWDNKTPGSAVKGHLSSFSGNMSFYAWDGTSLKKMSPERMTEWLDSQYKAHQRSQRD